MKIKLIDVDIDRLLNLPQLEFKTEVSTKTGELSTKCVSDYHFCKIIIYDSGLILFTGSIHKLWNSVNNVKAPNYNTRINYKGYNGNLFTLTNIIKVRGHLCELFNCNSSQMIFKNIELGINAELDFDPNKFIKGLLYHNNKQFEYRYNNNLAQAAHQRFIFKIYNKSKQYSLPNYTLRVELKIIKTIELKQLHIKSFEDINKKSINDSKEMILKRLDEVIYYDYTINKKNLNKSRTQLISKYSNPRFWIEELKTNHRDRHKKRLAKIIEENSNNLLKKIRIEIIKKCSIINQQSKMQSVA